MAKKDPIGQALQAGKDVTQSGQKRVEAILRDVSKATDRQSKQLSRALDELLERSRENTDRIADLMDSVDKQVRQQLDSFGVATKADLARVEAKLDELTKTAPPEKATSRPAPAKRAPAKRPAAKRASARPAAPAPAAAVAPPVVESSPDEPPS